MGDNKEVYTFKMPIFTVQLVILRLEQKMF